MSTSSISTKSIEESVINSLISDVDVKLSLMSPSAAQTEDNDSIIIKTANNT